MDFLRSLFTDPAGFYTAYHLLLGQVAVNGLLALSIGVTLRCGLLSQANVGFAAIGAYTSVLLHIHGGVPFALGVPAGGAAAAIVAAVIGAPVLRLRGVFLAIATIAFGEVVVSAILNLPVTGEGEGLINLDRSDSLIPAYAALAIASFALWRIGRGRVGEAWTAIREDSVAAAAHGVDVARYELLAFVIGGFLAGAAGAIEAHQNFFVDPTDYPFSRAIQLLVFAVVGGAATTAGPFAGAALLTVLPEIFRFAADYRDAAYGLFLLAAVIFRPQGMIGPAAASATRRRLAALVRRARPAGGVPA